MLAESALAASSAPSSASTAAAESWKAGVSTSAPSAAEPARGLPRGVVGLVGGRDLDEEVIGANGGGGLFGVAERTRNTMDKYVARADRRLHEGRHTRHHLWHAVLVEHIHSGGRVVADS